MSGHRRVAHAGQAVLEAALIASLVGLLAVGSVFARAGGNASGSSASSMSLQMVTDQNGDGSPNWNDWITFAVSTTATDRPWVKVNCTQNGAWVYTSSAGFFSAYAWNPYFDLASTTWAAGAANCTATMYMYARNGKVTNLATLTFDVAP